MVFTEIIETTPLGTDKGQILDENIRAFKSAVARNFEQISGYPDNTALVTQAWTTAGRPTTGLKTGLFGWNTTAETWERYNASTASWEAFGQSMASWAISGRPAAPYGGQVGYNTDLSVIERWGGSVWERVAGGRRGDIKMWSGAVTDIEAGWVLCDGMSRSHPEGGTYAPPNLQDKFIIGAGSVYAVGTTGGEAAHTLTVSEIPAHTHSYIHPTSYYDTHGAGGGGADWTGVTYAETVSTGGGQAHNNLPPYYALCYLYKL